MPGTLGSLQGLDSMAGGATAGSCILPVLFSFIIIDNALQGPALSAYKTRTCTYLELEIRQRTRMNALQELFYCKN